MDIIIGTAVYSVARPYIEKVIPAEVSNMMGGYGDEIALGGLGYFTAKGSFTKNKLIRSIGYGAIAIETSRATSGLTAGMTGSKSQSGATSSYGGWQ